MPTGIYNRELSKENNGVFKKGYNPWNKGTKGICKAWNKGLETGIKPWLGKKRPDMTGKNNPSWKGGIKKSDNRWYVYKPNHPFAHRNGYVYQYRLVAEKCLGRYLIKGEIIHHINGNESDDRPENLYLFENNGKHMSYHFSKNKSKLKFNLK